MGTGVSEAVADHNGFGVDVAVGVRDGVGVFVTVGVSVAVGVFVIVGVRDAVNVGNGVAVGISPCTALGPLRYWLVPSPSCP